MGSEQYRLKFRNHVTMLSHFSKLLNSQSLVDVTLVCDKVKLKAHKAVLAAFSPYFQEIFEENPCKHPVLIFDRSHAPLLPSILRFIYDGEVDILKENLNGFLALAESFQICELGNVEINSGSGDSSVRVQNAIDKPMNLSSRSWTSVEVESPEKSKRNTSSNSASTPDVSIRNGTIESEHPHQIQNLIESPKVSDDKRFNTAVVRGNVPDKESSIKETEKPCEVALDLHKPALNRITDEANNTSASTSTAAIESTSKLTEPAKDNPTHSNGQFDGPHNKSIVKMTPAKKEVILDLFYKQKKPVQEISDAMGISVQRIIQFITKFSSPVAAGKNVVKKTTTSTVKRNGPNVSGKTKKTAKKKSNKRLPATPPVPVSTSSPLKRPDLGQPSVSSVNGHPLREMDTSENLSSNSSPAIVAGTSGTKPKKSLKHPRISNAMKSIIVDLFVNKSKSFIEISSHLNVPLFKVKNLINRCSKATVAKINAAKANSSRGHDRKLLPKLSAEQQSKLLDLIRRNKKITKVGIQTNVRKEFGMSVSIIAISKLLKENDIKLDRPTSENSRVVAQNSLANIESRYEYALTLSRFLKQNKPLVYIGECAVESRTGPGSESSAIIYVLSALTKVRLLRTVSQRKPFDPGTFVEFLEQLRFLLPSVAHVFVMSNVVLHRSSEVNQWIRRMKYVQLFLPPRSPFLNPLQTLFRNLQKLGTTLSAEDLYLYGQQLRESQIEAAECNKWIQETIDYIPKCLSKCPILHMPKNPSVAGETSSQDAQVRLPETTANENNPPDVPKIPAEETRLPDSVEIIDIDE